MKRRSFIRVAVAAGAALTALPAVPPAPAGAAGPAADPVAARGYLKFFRDGAWYVVPGSVASRAGSGVLNRAAFHATTPLRQDGPLRDVAGSAGPTASPLRDVAGAAALTVRLLDRDGKPAGGESMAFVLGIDTDIQAVVVDGESLLLPPGRYALHGLIETPRAGREPAYAVIVHPDLRVDADAKVVLDARAGRRVRAEVDEPAARGGVLNLVGLTRADGGGPAYQVGAAFDPRFHEVYAASVPGAASDRFAFAHRESRREPEVELSVTGPGGFEVPARWFRDSPEPELRARLSAVHGGAGRREDLAGVDARGNLVLVELPGTLSNEEAFERIRNVQAAGARIAMVVTGGPEQAVRSDGEEPPFTVPTLFGRGVTAQRFAEAVRRGPVPVGLATHPVADHRYELAFTAEGAVPARLERRVRDRDLAAVRTAYHDPHGAPVRYVGAAYKFWGVGLDQGWTFTVRAPATRTEYFSPGTWDLQTHGYYGGFDSLAAHDVGLRAGTPERLAWNRAVAGPSLRGTTTGDDGAPRPWVVRDGDVLRTRLPLLADAAGHPRLPASWPDNGVDVGSQTLYREGVEIASVPAADEAEFAVPAGAARYRLVAEITRTAAWWPLSTRVTVAWSFRSSADRALPLPVVRFAPEVDLRNTAPGGREFAIPVTVEGQAGAGTPRVRSLTVAASYDDGRTWHPARVSGGQALVRHPGSGFVSLRAGAVTAGGEAVELTVIRAYQLR